MHVYSVLWTWLPRGELIELIFLEIFRMEGLCLGVGDVILTVTGWLNGLMVLK